jgi:hypothetical protein
MPQLICVVDARASTQKSSQCDWSPPTAGVVSLFAQAVDSYRQTGKSQTVTGVIGVPTLPTPTPTPILFSGRWTAPSYIATLRQTGTALRGEFKITGSGADVDGRITSGTARSDRVAFHVEFPTPSAPTLTATATLAPGTDTPTPAATSTPVLSSTPAMDFDCNVDAAATTFTCNWKDAHGRSGSVLFRRETNSP